MPDYEVSIYLKREEGDEYLTEVLFSGEDCESEEDAKAFAQEWLEERGFMFKVKPIQNIEKDTTSE